MPFMSSFNLQTILDSQEPLTEFEEKLYHNIAKSAEEFRNKQKRT